MFFYWYKYRVLIFIGVVCILIEVRKLFCCLGFFWNCEYVVLFNLIIMKLMYRDGVFCSCIDGGGGFVVVYCCKGSFIIW